MPNWSYNTLLVKGDKADLRLFKHAVCELDPEEGEKPSPLDFERHLPMPDELRVRESNLPAGEFPGWYSWRCEHWGTKWNAYYATLRGTLKSGELRYRFCTAYTPPVAWLEVVAAAHPELDFHLTYEEEFDQFSGEMAFSGGKLVLDEVWSSL